VIEDGWGGGFMATGKWILIADEIREQITSGRLKSGDRLPSTSQLCASYGVSAIVIRNAMIKLRAQGLVEGVAGVAVFVSDEAAGTRTPPPSAG